MRQVEVAHSYVVVAARSIPTGARVAATDVKLVAWPERSPVPGAFAKVDAVVNRGVIAPVLENEPLTETKLAPIEGGAGLPPTIPSGMRAISVRVNEVIGVAGFVTPGTRVDVFVTLKQGADAVTRVVVSNVQVLTAGTRYDQDKSKKGEPIPSSVVTLLLTPAAAERVVLSASEGQIMLALRNPLDVALTDTPGTRTAALLGQPPPLVQTEERRPPAPPRVKSVVAAAAPRELAAPPPKVYTVETIRAAKRGEEVVR